MKVVIKRVLHISILAVLLVSSFFFSKTKGLVQSGVRGLYYVTELLSSGSDDNITIEISTRLFIPVLLLLLFRLTKPMTRIEYIVINFFIILQILFLIAIEAGSIFDTIIYDHNLWLLIWVISLFLFVCQTQFMFFNNQQKNKIGGNDQRLMTESCNVVNENTVTDSAGSNKE